MNTRFTRWLGAMAIALAGSLAATTAHADQVFGVTTGNALIRFDTADVTNVTTVGTVNLTGGETVYGIDFRPATGDLHAVGSTTKQYKINTSSAAATAVGSGTFVLGDDADLFGVSFNPVTDVLHVVSNDEDNVLLDPTGVEAPSVETDLSPAGNVVSSAYSNSYAGATTTVRYGIDSVSDNLVTISPTGVVASVGPLGLDIEDNSVITFWGNTLIGVLRIGGVSRVHVINTSTGAASASVGELSGNPVLVGISVKPNAITANGPKGPIIPKTSIKLNFAKPGIADAISVAGSLDIPDGFNPSGKQVTVDVGGVTKTFTLDLKGKAKVGFDSFSVKVKFSKDENGLPVVLAQPAKFKFAAKKGNFAGDLEDEGLTSAINPGSSVQVPVAIKIGDREYQEVRSLFYKSNGKTGSAK